MRLSVAISKKILWCLSVHKIAQGGKSATSTKGDDKRGEEIQNNIVLIRLTGFAVELCPTVIAFDVCEQRWSKRAAPPGIFDFGNIGASALWTGFILGRCLHVSSRCVMYCSFILRFLTRKSIMSHIMQNSEFLAKHPVRVKISEFLFYFSCASIFSAVAL